MPCRHQLRGINLHGFVGLACLYRVVYYICHVALYRQASIVFIAERYGLEAVAQDAFGQVAGENCGRVAQRNRGLAVPCLARAVGYVGAYVKHIVTLRVAVAGGRQGERHVCGELAVGIGRYRVAEHLFAFGHVGSVAPPQGRAACGFYCNACPLYGYSGEALRVARYGHGVAVLVCLFLLVKFHEECGALIFFHRECGVACLSVVGAHRVAAAKSLLRNGKVGAGCAEFVGGNGLRSHFLVVGIAQTHFYLPAVHGLGLVCRVVVVVDNCRHMHRLSRAVYSAVGINAGIVVLSFACVVAEIRVQRALWESPVGVGVDPAPDWVAYGVVESHLAVFVASVCLHFLVAASVVENDVGMRTGYRLACSGRKHRHARFLAGKSLAHGVKVAHAQQCPFGRYAYVVG